MDSAGTVLAVAGGCRGVEAARDASAHPVHVAFVTKHAWTPGSADGSHRVLAAMGLWPKRCVAGTARRDFAGVTRRRRGWPPAALSQDRCVLGAVRSPRGSCLRSGTSPWPAGNRFRASRRCAGRVSPVRARADVVAPEAAVAPGTLRVTWHLPRLHAPEPRTGAPVQASVRRFSGVARTLRSNVAAPVGAGG